MADKKVVTKIIAASFHRNGIGGLGFHSILFESPDGKGVMHAALIDQEGGCFVNSVDELAKGNIQFACGNSWRGDQFERELRPMLKKFEETNGTNRLGPFSMIGG